MLDNARSRRVEDIPLDDPEDISFERVAPIAEKEAGEGDDESGLEGGGSSPADDDDPSPSSGAGNPGGATFGGSEGGADDGIDPDASAREHEEKYEEERKRREEAEARRRERDERARRAKQNNEFELLTIFDFLDQPTPTPLVAGVLPASGEVHVIFGESNAYKSFLAIDLFCSIATNTPWHGYAVDPGPVLYVVTEGANAATRKRVRGWFEHHGIPKEQWTCVRFLKVAIPLNNPDQVQKLIRTLKGQLKRVKLVVFDLLNGSMEGSDADGEVANAWVKGTQELSQATPVTQLHVTHSGFSAAGRSRGHSHLWGSFSTRLKAEGNTDARTAVLSVERHKDEDAAGLVWSFQLDKVPVGNGPEDTLVPCMIIADTAKSAVKSKAGRPRDEKRPRTAKHFLQALDLEAEYVTAGSGFDGARVFKVPRNKIRERMKDRGWLDTDDNGNLTNTGRSDFNRARNDCEARGAITEEKGFVWRL